MTEKKRRKIGEEIGKEVGGENWRNREKYEGMTEKFDIAHT